MQKNSKGYKYIYVFAGNMKCAENTEKLVAFPTTATQTYGYLTMLLSRFGQNSKLLLHHA